METTLPCLFLQRSAFVSPPTVFTLEPFQTITLAMRPRAILLTFLARFMRLMEDFFAAFDENDDRRLSRTKVNPKLLARSDENGDDELDLEEVRSAFDHFFGRPGRGDIDDRTASLPPDGPPFDNPPPTDGPPGEGRPGRPGGRPEEIFKRYDTNADGVLTGQEIPPFFSEKIDRNSDGEVTFDEIRKSMKELGPKAFLRPPGEGDRRPGPRGPGPRGPRPAE